MTSPQRPSRRSFLKTAATTGLALSAAPYFAFARSKVDEPNEPQVQQFPDLRIAYIGTGGIGGQHLDQTKRHGVQCPCFCDIDTQRYGPYAEQFPKARTYQDYRRMFDKEHKNIDAVMIGTPDHHHFPATMIAMQLGKHVYTQKPLAHTPWEARTLLKAAKRYRVATQMGNQGHAHEGWRLVYEWIHSGALGDVTEVHTWTDRPIWPQGMERPEGEDTVPEHVDWDAWVGPAPMRPYKQNTYHAFKWRGWWDFGAGALGDMACHIMDGMFWALDPGHPAAIEPVASTPVNDESFPGATVVKWEFAARGKRQPFAAYWYDGELRPPHPPQLAPDRRLPLNGSLFVGTKGSMLVSGAYGESPRIIPEARMREVGRPPQMLERSPGHFLEWLLACTGEKSLDYPKSNFTYAAPMSETILLGNAAVRAGRRLEYDGEAMRFTNAPEANAYLTKVYREGWKFDL